MMRNKLYHHQKGDFFLLLKCNLGVGVKFSLNLASFAGRCIGKCPGMHGYQQVYHQSVTSLYHQTSASAYAVRLLILLCLTFCSSVYSVPAIHL